MSTLQIIMIIIGILNGLIGVFYTIVGAYMTHKRVEPPDRIFAGLFFLLVSGIAIFMAVGYLPKMAEKERHEQEAIESYIWYLDGKRIDPKTITLSDYEMTYNDNDKIVTLSTSTTDRNTPMFLGLCAFIFIVLGVIKRRE